MLALALAAIFPLAVQTVAAPRILPAATAMQADPATHAALKLAAILYTEESQIRITSRLIDQSVGPALKRDENFIALEAEYPGLTDAMLSEVRPLVAKSVRKDLPRYHSEIAALIASRLTAAEIEDLTAFYLSPTGRKLVSGIQENYRAEAMLKEIVADPHTATSVDALSKDHLEAVRETAKSVDGSDAEALIALARKPYASKVRALGPEMRKLDQQLANEPDPEFEKQMEATMLAAVERFIAAADAKRSKSE